MYEIRLNKSKKIFKLKRSVEAFPLSLMLFGNTSEVLDLKIDQTTILSKTCLRQLSLG